MLQSAGANELNKRAKEAANQYVSTVQGKYSVISTKINKDIIKENE
jgi:hypothetical protein